MTDFLDPGDITNALSDLGEQVDGMAGDVGDFASMAMDEVGSSGDALLDADPWSGADAAATDMAGEIAGDISDIF
jgi:hypothetical protein